jgi:hypothetical protein
MPTPQPYRVTTPDGGVYHIDEEGKWVGPDRDIVDMANAILDPVRLTPTFVVCADPHAVLVTMFAEQFGGTPDVPATVKYPDVVY